MNQEENRLRTFTNLWPHPDISPIKLAKSGFYLSPTPQYQDRVVCFCCAVALVHWNKDHDPWTEHIKRSPTCGYVTGIYQQYKEEQRRLDSFAEWPLPDTYAATPAKLAKAGFCKSITPQYKDRCVCFCCGIALVRWDPVDDPWTEHVKHSKNCPFVRDLDTGNIPIPSGPEESSECTLRNLVGKLNNLGIDTTDTPCHFVCPITQEIFIEPVVAEDGHTYEKSAIRTWLSKHNTSPLTNKMLYSDRLIPNHNLNAQLIEYVENLIRTHTKSHSS